MLQRRLGWLGGGLHGRRLVADRLAELADAVSERFGQFGEAFGAEHDQRNRSDEQQVNGILDAHHGSD